MPLLTPSDRSAICGRNASEQVTAFNWNRWPDSVEYAPGAGLRGSDAVLRVPRGALAPAAYHQQPRAAARRDQTQDQGRRRLPGPGQRPQAHHGRRTQDHTRLGRPALPRPLTPPETGGRPSSLAEGEELPPLLHTNRDLTGTSKVPETSKDDVVGTQCDGSPFPPSMTRPCSCSMRPTENLLDPSGAGGEPKPQRG